MESQDIRKSTSDASTSRTENNSNDKESPEEMDMTTTTVVAEGEDDRDQLIEEEASLSSGLLMDADSLEGQSDDIQYREDSVPAFDHGRVRKSGVAKRQELTSARNLNKYDGGLGFIVLCFRYLHGVHLLQDSDNHADSLLQFPQSKSLL